MRGDAPGKPDRERDTRHLPSARVHPAASCPWRPRGHICRRDRPLPTAPASSLTVPALPQGVHPLGLWLGAAGLAFPFSFTGAWLADFLYVCILLEVSPRPVSLDSPSARLTLRRLTLRGSRTSTLCLCCFVSQSPHVTLSRVGVSHVRLTLRTQ